MKILLLSNPNSVHTIKWAKSLAQTGMDIIIFGLGGCSISDYDGIQNIKVKTLNEIITRKEGSFSKIKYLKALPSIKSIINEFNPDVVHAHYATSYGLLGAMTGFSPFVLSVWGSDVLSFPKKSFFHRIILQYNLKKADKILSTSQALVQETRLYTDKNIEITPFGIDMEQFRPMKVENLFDGKNIVIGTVKSLETVYGVEYLIQAFKVLSDKYSDLPLALLIVGGGSLEKKLKQLARDLSIEDKIIFTGKVAYTEVPIYHNMLDIAVFMSLSESFGVSVIESSSCMKPVIVSNVGGLTEVIEDGVTGFVVPSKDIKEVENVLEKLILDKDLRKTLGKAGRKRVEKLYNWNENLKQMIGIYQGLIK